MSCLSVSLSTTYILEKHDTHFFLNHGGTKGAKNLFFCQLLFAPPLTHWACHETLSPVGIDPPFLQNIPRMTQMYCFYHPHIYHHCHPHHLGHVSSANQTCNMFQRLHSIFVLVNFRICMHELMIQK